jgi:hypothetical protein
MDGAGDGNRTRDLLLTMEALCRLSYSGATPSVAAQVRASVGPRHEAAALRWLDVLSSHSSDACPSHR